QTLTRKSRDECCYGCVAADHSCYGKRQIMFPRRHEWRSQGSLRGLLGAQRGDEIVAPSWDSDDVAMAALAVAQATAQSADLNLQIRFLDDRLRPGSVYQFLFADDLAGAFNQSGQDVEGATTEPHWFVALEQQPLLCKEPERPKRDRVSVHGIARRIWSPF